MRTLMKRLLALAVIFCTGVVSAQSIHNLFPALPAMPEIAPMAPPTVLLSDTQGNIRFNSSSPYDLDVLLHQPTKAAPTAGMGKLLLPPQASDATPVPAMVILPGGSGVLPGREFEVLWELMTPPGRVVNKRMLSNKLSEFDEALGDNALEAFISRLRKKLAGSGARIRTLRGLGYVIEPETP